MLQIAARNLWRRKSRSLLAILALVIGILAIVLLISITSGLKANINELISGIGGIMVMEKGSQDQTLSKLDVAYGAKIEAIPGVRVALPETWLIIKEIDGQKTNPTGGISLSFTTALGLDPIKEQMRVGNPYGVEMLEGRAITAGDKDFALIGKKIADDYHKVVGSTIDVEGKKLKVIGIFGKSDMTDSVIGMHISDVRDLAGMDDDIVNDFIVQLTNPENEEKIATTIKFKWPDKLEASTAADATKMVGDMLGIIDQFFIIIAGIALVIAAVGIINTMLMAVRERVTEFGVLRAMGWTRDDVLRLIITESVLLGLAGGTIGIALAYAINLMLTTILPFPPNLSPLLAISAFLFSGLAGLAGGVYPAWKAANLDPIKAIRGEVL